MSFILLFKFIDLTVKTIVYMVRGLLSLCTLDLTIKNIVCFLKRKFRWVGLGFRTH